MQMSVKPNLTRRSWLLRSAAGITMLPSVSPLQTIGADAPPSWKMGLIADLHLGLAPDAQPRLEAFMQSVLDRQPDCILQLGDFNFGVDAMECMDTWEQFRGPRYHVLGNHDMDKATKRHMVDYWGMPQRYYSFDHQGWHFVVLDRNHIRTSDGDFVPYGNANFYVNGALRGFADPEQLQWLAGDLEQTDLPTVVFAHQGLGASPQVDSQSAAGRIESVLNRANRTQRKVRACFCGHHHVDAHHHRDGIHYVWINSASYYWVGEEYGRMAAYTDPLFTYLTFRSDGDIEVEPSHSTWASPTPEERGFPDWQKLSARISRRDLSAH